MIEHDVKFDGDYVELRFDADQVSIDEIMDELGTIGYRPQSYRAVNDEN